MKLSLLIPVYNGGNYWKECWSSVVRNLDLFDDVFISFNVSESQKQDLKVIENAPPKVHYVVQKDFSSANEHACKIIRWLKLQHLEGMLMILCHDDILTEGMKHIRETVARCDENSAVFGPFTFFRDGAEKEHELVSVKDGVMFPDSEEFFLRFHRTGKQASVSSIIIPAAVYCTLEEFFERTKTGWYAEFLLLFNPHIKKIGQNPVSFANVRLHEESERVLQRLNRKVNDPLLTRDTCIICGYVLSRFHGFAVSIALCRHFVWRLAKDPLNTIRTYFSLMNDPWFRGKVGLRTFIRVIPCTFAAGIKELFDIIFVNRTKSS